MQTEDNHGTKVFDGSYTRKRVVKMSHDDTCMANLSFTLWWISHMGLIPIAIHVTVNAHDLESCVSWWFENRSR
jgi:hypothetical protein